MQISFSLIVLLCFASLFLTELRKDSFNISIQKRHYFLPDRLQFSAVWSINRVYIYKTMMKCAHKHFFGQRVEFRVLFCSKSTDTRRQLWTLNSSLGHDVFLCYFLTTLNSIVAIGFFNFTEKKPNILYVSHFML